MRAPTPWRTPPPPYLPTMITTPVIIASALAIGAYGYYRMENASKYRKVLREINDILSVHDHLAEEMCQVDEGVRALWANQLMADRENAILSALMHNRQSWTAGWDEDDGDDEEDAKAPTKAVESATPAVEEIHETLTKVQRKGQVVYADKPREVSNHLVLKSRRLYVSAVVAECKNRFGRPERTTANRLAVRKFALDRMTSHGLRPTHVHQALPMVVELTFCESAAEREAAVYEAAARWSEKQRGEGSWLARLCGRGTAETSYC